MAEVKLYSALEQVVGMLAKVKARIRSYGVVQLAISITLASLSTLGCRNDTPAVVESAQAINNSRVIAEQIEPFINQLVREGKFSGVVLVAKDGKPLFRNAYGLASKEFQAINRTDTRFNLV